MNFKIILYYFSYFLIIISWFFFINLGEIDYHAMDWYVLQIIEIYKIATDPYKNIGSSEMYIRGATK